MIETLLDLAQYRNRRPRHRPDTTPNSISQSLASEIQTFECTVLPRILVPRDETLPF